MFAAKLIAVAALNEASAFVLESQTNPFWPYPSGDVIIGQTQLSLNSNFSFGSNATNNSILNEAFKRYTNLIAAGSNSQVGQIEKCTVSIENPDEKVELVDADEYYGIKVDENGNCQINAVNQWGVLRALETFSQTLIRDESTNQVLVGYAPLTVSDYARFTHRGLMIDTARHYLSVGEIQRIIESLPLNKFNKLHWHIVDAQSFPLDTPSEPDMVKGAFSPKMTYSVEDLATLTQFAHRRGVEIIFEFDVPGHTASWGTGKPDLLASCQIKYDYNINNWALNVANEEVYTTLRGILSDIVAATGTSVIHLGGDEVVTGCWAADPTIVQFMADQGWTSYNQLYQYFVTKADAIVKELTQDSPTSRTIHWEEVYSVNHCEVAPETIFQVWTSSDMMSVLTSAGFRVISSPSNYWYLDHSVNTWQVMYGYEPTVGLTDAQAKLVIGGEVPMWGEYIVDQNWEQMVYPRAQAVGERLWSPQSVNDTTSALDRMLIQHCRMLARGYTAGPVQPADYCSQIYV